MPAAARIPTDVQVVVYAGSGSENKASTSLTSLAVSSILHLTRVLYCLFRLPSITVFLPFFPSFLLCVAHSLTPVSV